MIYSSSFETISFTGSGINIYHPGLLLIVGTISILIIVNLFFKRIFSSVSFKRDVHKKTFNTVSGVVSLLSNPDSVLERENVKDSIEGYETLFTGARENVGTTSTSDSIEKREKEYKSMVNSFYDLVTDFYEWGWGQVGIDYYIVCI